MLMCDQHGIPVRLLAWETWYRFRGIGGRASRRTVCELRPSGHPDAMKKGWFELLVERGPAGEEARLLLFIPLRTRCDRCQADGTVEDRALCVLSL